MRTVPSPTRPPRHVLVPVGLAVLTVALVGLGSACSSADDPPSSTASSSTASSSTASSSTASGRRDVVTSSGPIELAVGARRTIELAANATTGYAWSVTTAPDPAVVKIVSNEYVALKGGSAVGAGGVQRIVVEGVASGTSNLALAYARPWESGVAPAETAEFVVTVA